MPKLHNPGCYCCKPPCFVKCPNGSIVDYEKAEWELDWPDTIDFWYKTVGVSGQWQTRFRKHTLTNLSTLNGTYVVERTGNPCDWNYLVLYPVLGVNWNITYYGPQGNGGYFASCPDENSYEQFNGYVETYLGFSPWGMEAVFAFKAPPNPGGTLPISFGSYYFTWSVSDFCVSETVNVQMYDLLPDFFYIREGTCSPELYPTWESTMTPTFT